MTTIIDSAGRKEDLIKACKISSQILDSLVSSVSESTSPKDLDILAGELCRKHGVEPSFLGEPSSAGAFPSNLCVMINDQAIHHIPKSERKFSLEDIVHIDFGIKYKGLNTDHGKSIYLGNDAEKIRMINTVKLSVEKATEVIKAGARVGDVSARIQGITELSGYKSIKNFCGHAVGELLHEQPKIPFVGRKNTGERIKKGMILAIENWITPGSGESEVSDDGWSINTRDGELAAFYEVMVLVENDGVLTLT